MAFQNFGLFSGIRVGDPDLQPPVAREIPKATVVHGEERIDSYYWLRERTNAEVIRYLESENEYTCRMMEHTEEFQEKLYQEMLSRIKETDLSVPERIDDDYYYSRTEKGKQYPIFCRKKGSLDAEEQILLDQNELAAGHAYFRIGIFKVSPNHRLLAYSVDPKGAETYTLYVKDLSTGKLLKEEIPNTYYSVEWAGDNQTMFYNILDAAKRPYQLYRHQLGEDPNQDVLIHHEKDDRFSLELSKTRSRQYLLMTLASKVTTEVRYLQADRPEGEFTIIHPRQQDMEYYVDHRADTFYLFTNENAKNFKLMAAPVANPSKANWKEMLPHREKVKIDGIDAFENHLVVYEREEGLQTIRVENLKKGGFHYVSFREPVYTISPARNPEFKTKVLRFNYSSLVTPNSVFDYSMSTRRRELKKQDEVLGGYDPALYRSERIFAPASDGRRIPVSLVYKRGTRKNSRNPLLLYGYGSYGATMDPRFSSLRLSLLDRGFIYAMAHIRGGGDLGRPWYEEGKFLKKKNTFTDFIACAEHLIAQKYTSKERLVIQGGSAGGLLVGAVTMMRPELFKAVVAKVPFVDVINTMLDPTIPLTVIEYEEWGNPQDKQYYEYMKSYSPYDNVRPTEYPHLLITAGLNDPRVAYWEPAKWTARLRAMKRDGNRLLLKTNMEAGHGGPSGRYDYLREIAFEYAFILDVLGVN